MNANITLMSQPSFKSKMLSLLNTRKDKNYPLNVNFIFSQKINVQILDRDLYLVHLCVVNNAEAEKRIE